MCISFSVSRVVFVFNHFLSMLSYGTRRLYRAGGFLSKSLRAFSIASLRTPRIRSVRAGEKRFPPTIMVQKRFVDVRKELKEIQCCSGCGVKLQYMEEKEYGYIPKDTLVSYLEAGKKPLCQRCHKVCSMFKFENSYDTAAPWRAIKFLLRYQRKLSTAFRSRSIR